MAASDADVEPRGAARPRPRARAARRRAPRLARVVEMRYFAGLELAEIAEVLDVSRAHGEARLGVRPRLAAARAAPHPLARRSRARRLRRRACLGRDLDLFGAAAGARRRRARELARGDRSAPTPETAPRSGASLARTRPRERGRSSSAPPPARRSFDEAPSSCPRDDRSLPPAARDRARRHG